MLVEEVMTKNVVTIDCNKTVFDACEIYSSKRVGSLVVMDRDLIVGIVTERDTIERVILNNRNPKKTKIIVIKQKRATSDRPFLINFYDYCFSSEASMGKLLGI